MNIDRPRGAPGFTLVELLVALLVLSLLSLMAWRGLAVVMDSRDHIQAQSERWRQVQSFFTRFEGDVRLAVPRGVRVASGIAPAWRGRPNAVQAPLLEFTRFSGAGSSDAPYRIAYGINAARQIELWIWPGLDMDADARPARYVVLADVRRFSLQYLGPAQTWRNGWPTGPAGPALPLAVRVQIELDSGETVVRVFAVHA